MYATRDQENVFHNRQTAAAAKTRAQTSTSHPIKTPGPRAPKTPFKSKLNDENAAGNGAETGLKTGRKGLAPQALDGKRKTATKPGIFQTPTDIRPRAPLGLKTTNAKATKAFQTPAPITVHPSPEKTQLKATSPRLRRAKLRVHQGDIATQENEPEPDIEHMPSNDADKALQDNPYDEFGPNKEYPQFLSENMMKGWADEYLNPVDQDGVSRLEKKQREDLAADDRYLEENGLKHVEKTFQEIDRIAKDMFPDGPTDGQSASQSSKQTGERGPHINRLNRSGRPMAKPNSTVNTLKAKSAASALSTARQPRPVANRPSLKASAPLLSRKPKPTPIPNPADASRHAVATAAARSTLGYAHGRSASSRLRKPVSMVKADAVHDNQAPSSQAQQQKIMTLDQGSEEADLRKLLGLDQRSDSPDAQEALEKAFRFDELNLNDDDDDDDGFAFTVLNR
ncbi:hypothetical protein P152DRAFT_471336 [Eremomyces bilateralis CBS 781.70]|uniref:Uncharacterized protein n=1 Tax=Eremomyces bilateralis CBS 781.70 TaxID=1392243 RepID=A0A6G1GDI5_9PEZI|nr:uncharacterized protein P152DRAFT_471336 [Eremomyces bilateralis CBS 781.70]KAF1815976.1 hypothetical protein P152DRAFT_471336 [Eremomyces bilateralis CBS 781.70]